MGMSHQFFSGTHMHRSVRYRTWLHFPLSNWHGELQEIQTHWPIGDFGVMNKALLRDFLKIMTYTKQLKWKSWNVLILGPAILQEQMDSTFFHLVKVACDSQALPCAIWPKEGPLAWIFLLGISVLWYRQPLLVIFNACPGTNADGKCGDEHRCGLLQSSSVTCIGGRNASLEADKVWEGVSLGFHDISCMIHDAWSVEKHFGSSMAHRTLWPQMSELYLIDSNSKRSKRCVDILRYTWTSRMPLLHFGV